MIRRFFSSPAATNAYEKSLEALLRATLSATATKVEDVSGGCGSSYRVEVESPKFVGLPKIKQHQMVNNALRDEIKKWHAITIITKPTTAASGDAAAGEVQSKDFYYLMVLAESSSSEQQQQQSPQIPGMDTVSGSSASSNGSIEGRESGSQNGSTSRRHTIGGSSTSTSSVREVPRRLTTLDQQSGIRYIPLGIRHDSFEVERHQRLLKTKFCRFGQNCEFARKGQCFFVHAPQELKYRPPRPDGYPVRDRAAEGYDDYDNYYYGDGEYYPNGQYYDNPSNETEVVEGYQQQEDGYGYQTVEAQVGRKTSSTEPALVAMELAIQIRDFVTTQDRLQLLVQAMNVLASSEAAEGDKSSCGIGNVASTLATSFGGSPATSSTRTEVTPDKENKRPSGAQPSSGGYPIKLEDHIQQTNFAKLDAPSEKAAAAVTTAEMSANSCAQHANLNMILASGRLSLILALLNILKVEGNNWLLQCSSCVDQSMFGDISLKSDIQPANQTKLYEQLRKMQLREFTHTEREFFNKFFATRQLGLIAQELQTVIPEAVSLIPERRWTSLNGTQSRTKNVYMLREAHLLMTALGALQELSGRHEHMAGDYWERVQKWSDEMNKMQAEMNKVSEEQSRQTEKVQSLNTKVHVVNHDLDRLETSVKVADERGKKQEFEVGRLKEDHRHFTSRVEDKIGLLLKEMTQREEALSREKLEMRNAIELEAERSSRSLGDLKDTLSALRSLHYSLAFLVEEYRRDALERGETMKESVDEMQVKLTRLNNSLVEYDRFYREQLVKLEEAKEKDRRRMKLIESNVTELWKAMDKQASADLVELTKRAELEVEGTMAKIRLEKMRLEMERDNMERQRELQQQADEHQDELHRRRTAAESERREAHDARLIEMQEESQIRQQHSAHTLEMERLNRTVEADREKVEAESRKEVELARVREEARLRDRRENEDINLREIAAKAQHDIQAMEAKAKEDRETALQNLRESVHQVRESVKWFFSSPTQVLRSVAFLAGCAASIYFTREMAMLARDQLNKRLGKPSLLRRTSRKSLLHDLRDWLLHRKAPSRVFSDVVLRPDHLITIKRLADATRTAKRRGQPLLHCMFYGPPGTGKTMTAERFAEYSGLEYAIMCGADVAPLNESAVTELHSLFDWVKKSRRGVLLFIDEADAFLGMGEHMRNALTTMLYHTGTSSSQFMLVLATNRPGDLDAAVLDRIDESVEFGLPDTIERHMMCRMYYDKYVVMPMEKAKMTKLKISRPSSPLLKAAAITVTKGSRSAPSAARKTASVRRRSRPRVEEASPEESCGVPEGYQDLAVDDSCLRRIAERLSGFSGREIAKLFMSLQTHIYSLGIESIEGVKEGVLNDVVESKLAEHSQTVDMMDNGYKYRGSR
ncbi:ATPase AAA domaincontaining protein [Perkinsus chesapeaki]|uniref:ATPase AAA domaincontaining protein n=1 Tax=Perkinsus chesapeaki TaxID=330153 RepID=A0A7J6LTX3_PERCH|nr:ATPase AAA domaincontaining protein [Perkinsus chesapeaki]